jgi:hypothetical protein
MTEKPMDAAVDSAWEKRGFLAGVIFVVLNIVGLAAGGSPPAIDASGEKIQEYFLDNDSGIKLGSILFAVALIFGTIWLASLWRAIGRLEPRGPRLALMAVVGFIISGAAAGVAQSMMGGLAARVDTLGGGGEFVFAVANALFGMSLAGIAVHMLALSALTMRSGFLPAWMGWLALVSGVASAVGTGIAGSTAGWLLPVMFIGFLSWLLWVLIASCMLYMRKAA